MSSSRINKYRDLRAGLKDEAGISRENIEDIINETNDSEDDNFLASINRSFKQQERSILDINDTLTEAKTFDLMRQESSEEINRALRSAKVSVGKEAQYNTRMDILNKIREPEKQVVHLDNLDNINTSEFSKGYFVNGNKEEQVEEEAKAAKKKMTLMERLASMSPEEDAKKAKLVMAEAAAKKTLEQPAEEAFKEQQEPVVEAAIDQTASLEDMLRQIKERDQREVEKVLKQKEDTSDLKVIKTEQADQNIESEVKNKASRTEVVEEKKNDRIATILNYVIIFLVVVFVGLCGMIGYQMFF